MSAPRTIQLEVNGKPVNAPDQIPIPEFLRSQELDPARIVVEWNGRAQTREEAGRICLSKGDRLELVRLVAGG